MGPPDPLIQLSLLPAAWALDLKRALVGSYRDGCFTRRTGDITENIRSIHDLVLQVQFLLGKFVNLGFAIMENLYRLFHSDDICISQVQHLS
jgi:hypothetical protein